MKPIKKTSTTPMAAAKSTPVTAAYFIHDSEDRPPGWEWQHWLEAESQRTRRMDPRMIEASD